MRVLIFSKNLSEIFLILSRTERDMIKNVKRCSCKILKKYPISMELKFSRKIFEKYLHIKSHEKYVYWKPNYFMCTDGQTWS